MKTGNVNQVAAFGKLGGICNDLGARYNPSKAALTPTALATLLIKAQQSLEAVNSTRATYVLSVNARRESYARLYDLVARVVRAVNASESSAENIRDARMLRRKLAPESSAKKPAKPPEGQATAVPNATRSSAQLDFQSKADTFAKLIKLLEGMPEYAPNEEDLKLTSLRKVLADLKARCEAVTNASIPLATARMNRNQILHGKGGVDETMAAVKDYIRSVFGTGSDVSKELTKLRSAA